MGRGVTSIPPSLSDPSGKRLFWTLVIGGLVSLGVGPTLFILNQGPLGASGAAGPGVASATYRLGDAVDIWRNESWLPGKIVRAESDRYIVAYDLAEVFSEEWVDASRLRVARER
jgi:hypothetical protein